MSESRNAEAADAGGWTEVGRRVDRDRDVRTAHKPAAGSTRGKPRHYSASSSRLLKARQPNKQADRKNIKNETK